MHKPAIALLLAFPALSLQAQVQRVTAHLSHKALLTLERAPFKAAGQVLKYYTPKQPNEYRALISINGKPVMGADGEVPKYVLAKATLLLNGRSYSLPIADMYNPWFGAGSREEYCYLLKAGPTYKLQAVFSDGAGTYAAEWRIAGGVATRTMLTADEDVIISYFQQRQQSAKPIKR